MKITKRKSRTIIESLNNVVNFDISIIDHDGIVVDATDQNTIGTQNSDALDVVCSKKKKVIGGEFDIDQQEIKGSLMLPILSRGVSIGVVYLVGTLGELLSSENFISEIVDLIIRKKEQEDHEDLMKNWSVNHLHPHKEDNNGLSISEQYLSFNNEIQGSIVVVIVELLQTGSKRKPTSNQLKQVDSVLTRSNFRDDFLGIINDHQLVIIRKVEPNNRGIDLSLTLSNSESLIDSLSKIDWLTFSVACGNNYDGTNKINISYQSALKALYIGKAIYPEKDIYLYTEMVFDVLLLETRDNWHSKHMFDTYENLTSKDKNHCLKKTLDSLFFSNLNIGKAADNLHIHRNTLRYRLDKIKERTGLDVTKLNNMFILYSALRLNQLNAVH